MCGTLLETPVEARRPAGAGLNHPGAVQPRPSQASPNQPTMDTLREKSFPGLDSFFEPEQPEQSKHGGRRILLLLALLAALGGAGWWAYTNYFGVAKSREPEATTSSAGEAPVENTSTKPAAQAGNAGAGSGSAQKAGGTEAKPVTAKPTHVAKPVVSAKSAPARKSAAKRAPGVPSAKASKLPEPAADDTGDAAFRKGEAYLYGRGVPKNCDEAVKYLKAASAKSNAKARSTFGTMYATGHCVPRDLPTAYSWFARALRVDPNNQTLEKDLSAVWNQMTPPERQMATKMKQ
jgi:hypothetical protein